MMSRYPRLASPSNPRCIRPSVSGAIALSLPHRHLHWGTPCQLLHLQFHLPIDQPNQVPQLGVMLQQLPIEPDAGFLGSLGIKGKGLLLSGDGERDGFSVSMPP